MLQNNTWTATEQRNARCKILQNVSNLIRNMSYYDMYFLSKKDLILLPIIKDTGKMNLHANCKLLGMAIVTSFKLIAPIHILFWKGNIEKLLKNHNTHNTFPKNALVV